MKIRNLVINPDNFPGVMHNIAKSVLLVEICYSSAFEDIPIVIYSSLILPVGKTNSSLTVIINLKVMVK